MAKRRRATRYHGILATPIPSNLIGRARAEAEEAKLDAILRHYGIARSPDSWDELAAVLLHEHVPGFREIGDHAFRWDYRTLRVLYILVEAELFKLKDQGDRPSIVKAVGLVASRMNEIYAGLLVGKRRSLSENALRKAYHEAKKRWGSGVGGILKAYGPRGALEP